MIKIEKLDDWIQTKISEMRVDGKTYIEIANYLNQLEEVKESVVAADVGNFFSRNTDKAIKVIKDNPALQEKMAQQYFNTLEQLNKLNEEIWGMYYEVKKEPELKEKKVNCPHCDRDFKVSVKDYSTIIKISEHILKQINHADKILGSLQTKSLNITYNFNDMNSKMLQIMPKLLTKFEKQGIIKINKNKARKLLG